MAPFCFADNRLIKSAFAAGLVAISLIGGLTAAFAQAASPGFDPLQPEKRFEAARRGAEQGGDETSLPAVSNRRGAVGGGRSFKVRGISLVGNRTISTPAIEPLYRKFVGGSITEGELGELAAKISELYRANGYHLTRAIVPAQNVASGVVIIKVVEGSITELVVDGEPQGRFGVKTLLSPILAEMPSRQQTLERQLLLLNSLPGIRVTDTSLREIGETTGAFRLSVFVKSWQVYASLGTDNLGSSSVGPWQSYATGAFNSYLVAGDALTINGSTIANDPNQLGFGRIGYDAPVGVNGVRLGGSAFYSEVRPGDWRREYGNLTRTQSAEIHASAVPIQTQRQTLTVTLGSQFTDVSEGDAFGSLYRDHLRTLYFTGDYRLKDEYGGVNYLTLTLRKGLDVLGASKVNDEGLSRYGGSAQAATVNLQYARYQSLANDWSVKIAGAGQFASTQLLTSQQFYLGGVSFGRGYGNAEISGDNAMAGSVELRFDGTLSFGYLRGYQIYGFAETGVAWNVGYQYTDGLSLASAGGGIRLFLAENLQADFGVGVPLSYRPFDNINRNPRFLFSISNAFRL
jgi:hemolysin activation/secretion protein